MALLFRSVPRVSRSLFTAEKVLCRKTGVPTPHHVVYTDGSCLRNGQEDSMTSIGVYWGEDHPWNLSEQIHVQPSTNMRAELWAAISALHQASAPTSPLSHVLLCTDSTVIVNAMLRWLPDWQARNWRRHGRPVSIRPEVEELVRLERLLASVVWRHVPREANQMAHNLAERTWRAVPTDADDGAPDL